MNICNVSKRTLTLASPLEKEGKGVKNTFTPHYALLSLSRSVLHLRHRSPDFFLRKSEPELLAAQLAYVGPGSNDLTPHGLDDLSNNSVADPDIVGLLPLFDYLTLSEESRLDMCNVPIAASSVLTYIPA